MFNKYVYIPFKLYYYFYHLNKLYTTPNVFIRYIIGFILKY